MNSPFLNDHSLLNSKVGEGVAENSPLWSWEYLLMRWDQDLFDDLTFFISACETNTPGLYNQRPFKNGTDDDYMSPDQLIAFAAVLHHNLQLKELVNMWSYLTSHWLTYDNLSGKTNKDRLMQPSAVMFVAALLGKWWAKPLLIPMLMHSSWAKPNETSGRLKAWTMMETLKMPRTKRLCSWILKKRSRFVTFSGCFLEYFSKAGQPIRQIARSKEL